MRSLRPDGTFAEEPAIRTFDTATDVSAAPLWAAFRDRYTRARRHRDDACEGFPCGLFSSIGHVADWTCQCE
jgi:hypothetical protein